MFPLHDSAQIFYVKWSAWQSQCSHIRQWYRNEHDNWNGIPGDKSKWWVWSAVIELVKKSVIQIQTYLQRTSQGRCFFILCKVHWRIQALLPGWPKFFIATLCQHAPRVVAAVGAKNGQKQCLLGVARAANETPFSPISQAVSTLMGVGWAKVFIQLYRAHGHFAPSWISRWQKSF